MARSLKNVLSSSMGPYDSDTDQVKHSLEIDKR